MRDLPKRLIEVDLPIKRISEHARREKSIRHGHISTLHIWWARRPLAACRAVLCASLWPDPADPHCPQSFRDKACRIVNEFARKAVADKELAAHCSHENWSKWQKLTSSGGLDSSKEAHWNVLRFALLDFIADFANWDNSNVLEYLKSSRALTDGAYEGLEGLTDGKPMVLDPFAGGGAIPLEALRVGADAYASDLNPVAILLDKVLLEYIPKYGMSLADEVHKWGAWIKKQAEHRLANFYPPERDTGCSLAYIWARTVVSEAPAQGDAPVEIPLLRSMWLSSKAKRRWAFRWVRDANGKVRTRKVTITYQDGTQRCVRQPQLEIFQPKTAHEVEKGTSLAGSATCPVSGYTNSVESVREQLKRRKGGTADARLLCVIATPKSASGRVYRLPSQADYVAAENAKEAFEAIRGDRHHGLSRLPDGKLNHLRGFFNVVLYGMTTWGDLFSPRQAVSLCEFVNLVKQVGGKFEDREFGAAVQTCLALALDRCADKCASVVVWHIPGEKVEHVFGRQALPMVWDFAEANILSDIGWSGACEWVEKVIENNASADLSVGTAVVASATAHPLPDDTLDAVVTDPPYYAAIPYADLSDFFYSWLKRSVGDIHHDLFREPLAPKEQECVSLSHRAAMYRNKDAAWFESMMTKACAEARRMVKPSGVGVFVFANKETSGWEAMLAALIASGWVITGSWPIDTEMGARLRARNSAALASSVHLICRPRQNEKVSETGFDIGDWRDVLQELPRRMHQWLPRLAEEGVVGADAIFACLGPALEIFSKYSRVEKANGDQITLKEYLQHVWAAVAQEALGVVFKGADASGFEEDARLTAMWLWTLFAGQDLNGGGAPADDSDTQDDDSASDGKTIAGYVLEYDAARKIAQGLGAHLESLTSLVEVKGETARLLPVAHRTRYLFGGEESGNGTEPRKKKSSQLQLGFEAELEQTERSGSWGTKGAPSLGATVLDRVHQSMIMFAAGRSQALRRFLVEEGVGRDERFWRLAQVLSYLYPKVSDEKRWIDGVLARKKGLGF